MSSVTDGSSIGAPHLDDGAAVDATRRLASGIAHQLNNILTVVGGHASVLMEDLGPDHPGRPSVEAIAGANEAAVDLTTQLLRYAGQLSQDPRECTVGDLMAVVAREAAAFWTDDRSAPSMEPSITHEANLPTVLVDPALFAEVIGHLTAFGSSVLNGFGDIDLTATAGPLHNSGPPVVTVHVTISGPQLPPIVTDGLFEPFVASRHGDPADGMRLSAAWGVVQRWGGRLSAKANNRTLTFSFTVPGAA